MEHDDRKRRTVYHDGDILRGKKENGNDRVHDEW